MQLDRPQAKFRLKSDLNCLFIDLCDPIPAARFTRRDDLIPFGQELDQRVRF